MVFGELIDLLFLVFGLVDSACEDIGEIFDISNEMGGGWVKKN